MASMSAPTIGIDLGTSCGWALLLPDGACVGSGTWDLKGHRHDSHGMRVVRLRRNVAELVNSQLSVAHTVKPLVAYEAVEQRHKSADAAHLYGALRAGLQEVCAALGVELVGVPVSTVKRTATGKGNAGKPEMLAAAAAKWPTAAKRDDNEADALWVAECARTGRF